MRTKIQKWGNSLGLRVPCALAEEAGVQPGSEVDVSFRRGELVVKPVQRKTYRLKNLLRKITPENIHTEIDTGAPVGKEVW